MIKGLGERMIRAAKLDGSLYDEIKTDRRAPLQAALVVILSAIAAGVGVVVQTGVGDFFLKTLQALLEWYILAFFYLCSRHASAPGTTDENRCWRSGTVNQFCQRSRNDQTAGRYPRSGWLRHWVGIGMDVGSHGGCSEKDPRLHDNG